MTIKTILAPISGNHRDGVTLATAFHVADDFDAHVDVLFARLGAGDAVPLIGEGMSSTVIEDLMTAAEHEWTVRTARARRCFDEAVAAYGMTVHDTAPGPGTATAVLQEMNGREDWLVRRACPLCDLVVLRHDIGREADDEDGVQLTMTLEAALINGGRPILLAPVKIPRTIGRTIAIAWDGGAQCARAVSGAMPMLHRAEAVHILCAATGRTEGGTGEQLSDYLAWHGIESKPLWLEPRDGKVGETVLGAAGDLGADLLVMGGYSHSRMHEMILGGVTRFVLGHATLPVIMAH